MEPVESDPMQVTEQRKTPGTGEIAKPFQRGFGLGHEPIVPRRASPA